jgi:hypothetical protein
MTLIEKLKIKPGAVAIINAPKSLLPEFRSFQTVVIHTGRSKTVIRLCTAIRHSLKGPGIGVEAASSLH